MINKDITIENLQEEIYELEEKLTDMQCDNSFLRTIISDQQEQIEELSQEKYKIRCHFCGNPLTWSNNFSFEDYGIEGEGIVSTHICGTCDTTVDFYCPIDEETIAVG